MAADLYLTLPGVPGNHDREAHQGQLELRSWEIGVERQPSTAKPSATVVRPLFAPLRVTLVPGLAGPQLLLLAANGALLSTAVLTVYQVSVEGSSFPSLTLSLSQASVLEAVVGQEDDDTVMTVSLDYRKVQYTARRPKPDGTQTSTSSSWDLVTNRQA